jgi:ADP-L-glycero-D-manno-heptose 6-epimerase
MGACSSTTEQDCDFLMQNNFEYSKVLAEYALSNSIRFVYASSAATYGDGRQGYDDEHEKCHRLIPLNPYGYSKQLFDLWLLHEGYEKNVVGLKFFNVFGPNEYHKEDQRSMVLKAWEQIRATGKIKLFKSYRPDYKDGEQKRDFIYIKDCLEPMWWLIQHDEVNGIFNLGTGVANTWLDLAGAVFEATGLPPKIEFIDMPAELKNQYQYYTEAKMGKLRATGCPFSARPLKAAIRDYIQNHLEGEDCFLSAGSV